ncbi:MAG: radical SAM protein [bacterium]
MRVNNLSAQSQEYKSFLKRENPNIVAFSATTNMFPCVVALAPLTKSNSDALTICGGVHATINPEEVITTQGIDMVCVGEGELALAELCDTIQNDRDITGIANIWVKQDGKIYRNQPRALIEELDILPFVDREILSYKNTFDLQVMRRGVFMASRGCPNRCSYCCNHVLKQIYPNKKKYVRFRSVSHVIEEIEKVIFDFPTIELVTFHDDILPLNKSWFEEFVNEYRRKFTLPFELNCHPNLLTKEIAKIAKSGGCIRISIGIESGNDWLRKEILNRYITKQQILDAFSICNELGIKTLSYNMIGLPFETRRKILDTIQLNAKVRPHGIQVSIFYPYQGTKLFEVCQNEKLLSQKKWVKNYFKDTMLQLKDLTPSQLKTFLVIFKPLVWAFSKCEAFPTLIGKMAYRGLEVFTLGITSRLLVNILLPLLQGTYVTLRFLKYKVKRAIAR